MSNAPENWPIGRCRKWNSAASSPLELVKASIGGCGMRRRLRTPLMATAFWTIGFARGKPWRFKKGSAGGFEALVFASCSICKESVYHWNHDIQIDSTSFDWHQHHQVTSTESSIGDGNSNFMLKPLSGPRTLHLILPGKKGPGAVHRWNVLIWSMSTTWTRNPKIDVDIASSFWVLTQ